MSYNYFMDKISEETRYMVQVIDFLKNELRCSKIVDVTKNPEYQKQDIDLLLTDELEELSAEVKIRLKDYNDILIETYSCFERRTEGNIYFSKAFYYVYAVIVDDKLKKVFVMHLPSLRDWFNSNKQRYEAKYAPNPPDNPVYNTQFYAVPIKDLPPNLFLVKKTF